MFEIFQEIFSYLTAPLFTLGDTPFSLLGLLKFVVVFWLGFYLGKLFRAKVARLEIKALTNENKAILSNLGYYAIVIGTICVGLSTLGINLNSLAFIAGAVSVGVGFGLQNIVSNFISGIILMFEKTVRVGDLIELPTKERGRVRTINMRSTVIVTSDNIDIVVPNTTFITQNITNFTFDDNIRRLIVPFGAAYGSSVEQVRRVVLAKVESSTLNFARTKPLEVRLMSLGASSLDFVLVVFVPVGVNDKPSYEYDFLPLIYDALNEAKIAIPFPQMDIHLQSDQ